MWCGPDWINNFTIFLAVVGRGMSRMAGWRDSGQEQNEDGRISLIYAGYIYFIRRIGN